MPLPTDGKNPLKLNVSYCYGFSGDIGGGSYDRQQTLADLSGQDLWLRTISGSKKLQDVLADWQTPTKSKGVIRITDNGIYGDNDPMQLLMLPASSQLTLEAADGTRPAIQSIHIVVNAKEGASLTLNGLLLNGKLSLFGKKLKLTPDALHRTRWN